MKFSNANPVVRDDVVVYCRTVLDAKLSKRHVGNVNDMKLKRLIISLKYLKEVGVIHVEKLEALSTNRSAATLND
jgi:hypothetical protein